MNENVRINGWNKQPVFLHNSTVFINFDRWVSKLSFFAIFFCSKIAPSFQTDIKWPYN